jgi:regulator of protease activity HflC (stomatin/prohibitin superfamily)
MAFMSRADVHPKEARRFSPLHALLVYFIEGDHVWADYRWVTVWVLIVTLALFGRFLEHVDPADLLGSVALVNRFPVVGWVTRYLPVEALLFVSAFFTRLTVRYWIPPLFGAALAFVTGALYLLDVFELKRFWSHACRYLYYALFENKYFVLRIPDERPGTEAGDAHLLNVIGGPGYVEVKLGHAVLCERGGRPADVYGAGQHFLRRFETVREAISLEEQHRRSDALEALTRDGLPVVVRDLEATFRVRTGRLPRTPENPYPFQPGAVRQIVYGQPVSERGVGEWQAAVLGAVKGRVAGWIASQTLDALTAPLSNKDGSAAALAPGAEDSDPRRKIRELFERPEVRKQFADLGVELLWVSIGHIDCPPEVDAQRLALWRAEWEGNNAVTRARAEAVEIDYTLRARAEAQAETIKAITSALKEASAQNPSGAKARLTDLILLHMAQILEGMTAPPGLADTVKQLESPSAAG